MFLFVQGWRQRVLPDSSQQHNPDASLQIVNQAEEVKDNKTMPRLDLWTKSKYCFHDQHQYTPDISPDKHKPDKISFTHPNPVSQLRESINLPKVSKDYNKHHRHCNQLAQGLQCHQMTILL